LAPDLGVVDRADDQRIVVTPPFEARETSIPGLFVVDMKQIRDDRGVVREFYRRSDFGTLLPTLGQWAQINVTETQQGAIRGLHGEETNKFVGVVAGGAFGVYLDARPPSPTYGKVETVVLHQGVGVHVSTGICNGFQAVAPGTTQYLYCFDQEWQPGMAGTSVNPLDRDLAIRWPIVIDPSDRTLLSEKDAALPCFFELGPEARATL
jgi:dTDP-4-dehydrorhamnose 3,5-epimerase